MSQAFSAAIATAAKLLPDELDVIVSILLEEIGSEERWNSLFAGSQNLLQELAAEAIRDSDDGSMEPLDHLE